MKILLEKCYNLLVITWDHKKYTKQDQIKKQFTLSNSSPVKSAICVHFKITLANCTLSKLQEQKTILDPKSLEHEVGIETATQSFR